MNNELWTKAHNFHGHQCPGLAIGVKVCEAAIEKLNLSTSTDEELLCIAENDACSVDAIQVLLGCSLGKGNLIYRNTGKQVYSFFNRTTNESIRIYFHANSKGMDRQAFQNYILNAPIDEVCSFSDVKLTLPEKARRFKNQTCSSCGETMSENKAHFENGNIVCIDCFTPYNRGW